MTRQAVLSLLWTLVAATTATAQILPTSQAEYDAWKLTQLLPVGDVVMLPDGTELVPPDGARTSCDCWVEPDNSYTTINNNLQWNAAGGWNNADDGSHGPINLGFPFHLYGQNYFSAYINTNGNITFGQPYTSFTAAGFPLNGYAMVAPFWADVDLRGAGAGNNIVRYKVTPTALYVNWINVGYYNSMVDKRNTFQVIITNGNDPAVPHGANVSFCYKDMQWTTGSASGGSGGFGGTPANVGANRGSGGQYIQFGRFSLNNSNYDGPFGANDGVHWLDNKHFIFATDISSANVPPVATSETVCDSMVLCVGQSANLDVVFLSPEPTQTTTVTVSSPTLTGLNILTNTPGVSATVTSEVTPTMADVGEHIVTFTATDNGSPVMTTIFEVRVIVQPAGELEPGSLTVCSSATATPLLNGLPGVPPGGTWTGPAGTTHNGLFNPATDAPGNYTYTVLSSGSTCASTGIVTVSLENAPQAGSNGTATLCSNGPAVDLVGYLGGTPMPGGTWLDAAGTPVNNMFDPAVQASGSFQYVVAGGTVCPDAIATVDVTVNPAPDAGGNATVAICADATPFAMLGHLTGTPATTGTWTGPVATPTGMFDPAVHPAGTYTYSVPGTAPCVSASATLEVQVQSVPTAGTNGQVVVCTSGPLTPLFPLLGGAPPAGGTWADPSGQPHSGLLDPATASTGSYTYSVAGQGECAHLTATASVAVTVQWPMSAGENATVQVCPLADPLAMSLALGGTPAPNGTWTGPSTTNGTFIPGTHQPGVYTYTVPGVDPCPAQSATLTISLAPVPSAGEDGTLVLCENGPTTALLPLLGSNAQPGGAWTGPTGEPFSGNLYPFSDPPGAYQYVVQGQGACAPYTDVAYVQVTIQALPNPGQNATINLCIDADPVDLFASLTGWPQTGGTWTGPSSTNGTFLAGTHQPGVYTYTVAGTAPCPSQSATVTVGITPAPNAGGDGQLALCNNGVAAPLAPQLTGPYDPGGQWLNPAGAPSVGAVQPQLDPAGTYLYVVQGAGPCGHLTDTAAVLVTIQALPNAGVPTTVSLCMDAGLLDMTATLNGDPAPNGTWTDPSGQPMNGSFQPGAQAPGVYTYTVPGTAPCPSQSSTLSVGVVQLPNAGDDGSLVTCINAPPTEMFGVLQGNPQANGTWFTPTGIPYGGWLDPATHTAGQHRYVVTGTGPCSHASDTAVVWVTIDTLPEISFAMWPLRGCHPLEVNLMNTTAPELIESAQWTMGDGTVLPANGSGTHLYLHPGVYTVTLQVQTVNGCQATTQGPPVIVDRAPEATFVSAPNPLTSANPTLYLSATDPNAVAHVWTLDGTPIGTGAQTQATLPNVLSQDLTVCLHVEDQHGCESDNCRTVHMIVPQISVPNAFTPDGDGVNDVFLPILTDIDPSQYLLEIFDRWGQLVFSTEDPHKGWDGDGRTPGVYVWQLSALPLGTADRVTHVGPVTLVR